jgi:polyhydroxybutyrate depolymerase
MDSIYVAGHSLGWWFSNTLACARGDIIRGVWSVWWSITAQACAWPVEALIMHHPDDRLASFAWWEQARDHALLQNGCSDVSRPLVWWPTDGNCIEYTECNEWWRVVRCPHSDSTAYNGSYYPHTWPNFAGKMIWDFFVK